MLRDRIAAILGQRPFDVVIDHVRIVNVYTHQIQPGCVGIVGDSIAYAGERLPEHVGKQEINGRWQYLLPGLVDSHMHLESSMLTPARFAGIALSNGTTTVVADPHEIVNVKGMEGLKAMLEATADLPLRIIVMAPSTVPSLPGYESSGWVVDADQMRNMLDQPGVAGLGEVMDFNGVASGEQRILDIIDVAACRGCVLDGHASVLTGARLQAFRATGIDSDHTTPTAEKLAEELALGFTVQIQESMLSEEMVRAMNQAKAQDRICLVTDDVPLPKLMHDGHLNHVAAKAVALGLDPLRAVRFTTINPATRMRLRAIGGIAPGMIADLQLMGDLERFQPTMVFSGGRCVFADGHLTLPIKPFRFPVCMTHSMLIDPVAPSDFRIVCPPGDMAVVNVIHQNGCNIRTEPEKARLPIVKDGGLYILNTDCYCKMAVFNRYGSRQRSLALIDGLDGFHGAVALTYGHDSHNLMVYGKADVDMAAAANAVIASQGGIAAAAGGHVICHIPLPIGGIMSEEEPGTLLRLLDNFLEICHSIGFLHKAPMSFFTTMALAVSPKIKCTDKGLLDVVSKKFIPLIEKVERAGK